MSRLTKPVLQAHVAVFAFPFASHPAALLAIVNRLADALPNTSFTFFSTAQSNSSIFSSKQNQTRTNVKAFNVWDGVPDGYVFGGKRQEDIELFMRATPQNFRKGIEVAMEETGRKVSCLLTDAFLYFGKEMADEIGVPWVPFYLSGASSLSSHIFTDLIREKIGAGGLNGLEDETLSFIPGMSAIHIGDLPEGILVGNLQSIFSTMLHQMGKSLPSATAVVVSSVEELEPTITNHMKSNLKNFLSIIPFILSRPPFSPDHHNCLPWLDTQKPKTVAYISFGSVAIPPPAEIVALAESLEASRVPFLWSLRDKWKEYLPNGFLKRVENYGKLVPWAPQLDVLNHIAVGVFVSHAGWNSLIESIVCGVPLIVRPFFGDHGINARMVDEVWRIGVMVENGIFSRDGLMGCLDIVLKQEKGKKLKENVKELKGVAERAVGPDGSSTNNFKLLLDLVS